jgi:hypothetical protein
MSIIIGAKKKAQELPLMSEGEIKELIQGSERLLEQGVPLEVPAAVRVGDLVRISSTMKRHRELLAAFVDKVDELKALAEAMPDDEDHMEPGVMSTFMLDLFVLEGEVKEVIDIQPPPLIQPSPLLEV